ncbi:xanthine dehydrogenase accessory protein XdhC [Tepidimonas sediminis]|uniref:Xanthine dehydrogenase accessory protein XdhC n=1 Tax=Tepidimonas sediminis TaxID=2588941 RepID=A0A554WR82_9BURK|nr:xanthine dehydrogenase accessory protein XdhC [Tepidimonas sediminis]TSE26091.1 xanthine dehydrogenase accessory protein XdhC [Tepidimonas sediminis]
MGSEADFQALQALLRAGPVELVRVQRVAGSAPREPGAWMAVGTGGLVGTIGGGHLEWQAQAHARARLQQPCPGPEERRVALGPTLGQCCGGVVWLAFERLEVPADAEARRAQLVAPAMPVALFGAGHVGRALVAALAPLPFALRWIDAREPQDWWPAGPVAGLEPEPLDPPADAVPALPSGSAVLVMTHRHDLDLAIVEACLQRRRARDDLPFIGLIGSRSKWASFTRRLRARGWSEEELTAVTCPIGLPGIPGKQPAVIAASVAAQLLQIAYTLHWNVAAAPAPNGSGGGGT